MDDIEEQTGNSSPGAQEEWRETLRTIFTDANEGKRIIDQTGGISNVTITRWISGEITRPRKVYLKKVLQAVEPNARERLLLQLQQANLLSEKDVSTISEEEELNDISIIPTQFYDQVVRAVESSTDALRTWSICQLVLRQCSAQLGAAEPVGPMISILSCTPPANAADPIRSLRELIYIQPTSQEGERLIELNTRFLLGAESIAGQACIRLQAEIEQPIILESTVGLRHFLRAAKSAAAYPLLRSGRVVGCMLLMSEQEHFFTQARMRLIQSYGSLAALAFRDIESYDISQLNFSLMPLAGKQELIATVRQRTVSLMRGLGGTANSQREAEVLAWHHIEDEQIKQAQQ